MKNMVKIGFSTGCLHQSKLSLDEKINLFYSLGANALELSFGTPDQLFDCQLSSKSINQIKKFKYLSIHAPFKEIRYRNDAKTKKIINKLQSLHNQLNTNGIVLHPDLVDDFKILTQSELPFLLENMDTRKKIAIYPEQFKEYRNKYTYGFVLDLEHAYEHDSTMNLAQDFIQIMSDRIMHLHVSGQNKSKTHIPIYKASNKSAIIKAVKSCPHVPIILEGVLTKNIATEIKKELSYLNHNLSPRR